MTYSSLWSVARKRYQAVGFPCNRMLKLSSSRGIRIDVPVLSVSWSFVDHSVIIQALRKGLLEREASDTGGVPRWKSSCPDRLAEATSCSCLCHIHSWFLPMSWVLDLSILLSIFVCIYMFVQYIITRYISATVVHLVQRIIAASVVVIWFYKVITELVPF